MPGAENTLYEFRSVAPATSTNVYTVFRALIEDFTVPGTLALAVVLGFVVGAAWQGVLKGARPRLSIWIVVAFLAAAMLGLLSSIFAFTNVCLGFAIFAVLLVLTRFEPVTEADDDDEAGEHQDGARARGDGSAVVDRVHPTAAGTWARHQ